MRSCTSAFPTHRNCSASKREKGEEGCALCKCVNQACISRERLSRITGGDAIHTSKQTVKTLESLESSCRDLSEARKASKALCEEDLCSRGDNQGSSGEKDP